MPSVGQESIHIQNLSEGDKEYQQLKGYIIKGFPDH